MGIASLQLMWTALAKAGADADRCFDEGTNPVPEHRDRKLLNPPEQDTKAERVRAAISKAKKKFLAHKLADFAPGLPSKENFGDVTNLPLNKLTPYVVQEHNALKAKKHYDIRFGPDEMFSWASRKGLPAPGKRHLAVAQPLHEGSYASFQGTITSGYGAGTVKTEDKGSVIVTKAKPNQINFVVAHKKAPEMYTLVKTKGKNWLLVNTTPQSAAKMLGGKPEEVGLNKPHYTSIPAAKVEKVFDPKYLVQNKIDGASALFHLLNDRIDAISYRTTKDSKPIIHSYRIFGPSGGINSVKVPKRLAGTILRGEVYGVRKGKAIPPQELGGLLNSSVAKSLEDQKSRGIELKNMIFNVVRRGKTLVGDIPAATRQKMLDEILPHLPADKFHLPETAETPTAAKALWENIVSGKNPLTEEGIVAWPRTGGRPIKVKNLAEQDVFVRSIFPGTGKYKGSAGGLEYSRGPEGPIVGRVGTGFSDETRKAMAQDPESWVGRLARVRSQQSFPGGALRAPSFIGLHEDYPSRLG